MTYVVAASLGAAFLLIATASAATPTAQLEYTRGAGTERCPDADGLRALVAARLGYDPIQPDGATRIRASIVRVGDQLRASLAVHDANGNPLGVRELTSSRSDCAELAASMALAVSIAIDPLSLSRPQPPAPAPSPPPPPPPTPAPTPTPALAAPPPPERVIVVKPETPPASVQLHAGIGVTTSVRSLPSATVGGLVMVGASYRWLSLDLEGSANLPASTTGPEVPGFASPGQVSASLLLGTLVPCVHLGLAFGCGLASFGQMQASGGGVDIQRQGTAAYTAFGGRLGAEYFFNRILGARIYGDLLATPNNITLNLNNQAAWSNPTLSMSLGLSLLARLP